jgi:hypothetical protein
MLPPAGDRHGESSWGVATSGNALQGGLDVDVGDFLERENAHCVVETGHDLRIGRMSGEVAFDALALGSGALAREVAREGLPIDGSIWAVGSRGVVCHMGVEKTRQRGCPLI